MTLGGKTLTCVAEAPIGHWAQGATWSPDSKTILVGNMKVNGGAAAIRTGEK